MIKYYCDGCNKEIDTYETNISIPYDWDNYPCTQKYRTHFCRDCVDKIKTFVNNIEK